MRIVAVNPHRVFSMMPLLKQFAGYFTNDRCEQLTKTPFEVTSHQRPLLSEASKQEQREKGKAEYYQEAFI